MPLDRDQPTHDHERGALGRRSRRLAWLDPVVHDLERPGSEPLRLLEVAREPARDRDVDIGQARNRPVGSRERARRAELVEAVLGADAHRHPRQPRRCEAVEVGVHEVGVDDRRVLLADCAQDPTERQRTRRVADAHALERDAHLLHPAGELPGSRLVLVEQKEPDIPAALSEPRQQREQVVLRSRDALHLPDVQHAHAHSGSTDPPEATATTRSAHPSTP